MKQIFSCQEINLLSTFYKLDADLSVCDRLWMIAINNYYASYSYTAQATFPKGLKKKILAINPLNRRGKETVYNIYDMSDAFVQNPLENDELLTINVGNPKFLNGVYKYLQQHLVNLEFNDEQEKSTVITKIKDQWRAASLNKDIDKIYSVLRLVNVYEFLRDPTARKSLLNIYSGRFPKAQRKFMNEIINHARPDIQTTPSDRIYAMWYDAFVTGNLEKIQLILSKHASTIDPIKVKQSKWYKYPSKTDEGYSACLYNDCHDGCNRLGCKSSACFESKCQCGNCVNDVMSLQ